MSRSVFALIILIIALSIPLEFAVSETSTGLQPEFNRAIVEVRKAEAAGATPTEISSLVASLNKALDLSEQAMRSTDPASSQQRTQLLSHANETLTKVEDSALQLQATAAQRTTQYRVLAYVGAGVAALLATLAYALSLSFYRRYRVKRTLQMKLKPK
jgi:ElaB/YqjD/DUF883 family membrane-anchored ribosome-binding protein